MVITCVICGRQVEKRRRAKTCSDSCRSALRRRGGLAALEQVSDAPVLFWPDLYYGMCPDGSDVVTIEGVIASAIAQAIDDDVVPAGLVTAAKARALEFADIEAASHT